MAKGTRAARVVVVSFAALAACGDGSAPAIDAAIDAPIDAPIDATPIDAATVVLGVDCDPVAQTGCPPGTKCGHLIEAVGPTVSQTTCVPNGSVAPGGSCTVGEPGPATGYDDCMATSSRGYDCLDGMCSEVCAVGAPDTGCAEELAGCVKIPERYDDIVDGPLVGLCRPGCDPVAQDCAIASDGCYMLGRPPAVCIGVPQPAAGNEQGNPCYGNGFGCFLNGCAKGYGALLPVAPDAPPPFVCAFFCTPVNTTLNQGSAATAVGLQNPPRQFDCNADIGESRPGPGSNGSFECRFLNSFYADTGNVSAAIGFCVETAVWGSCTEFDLEACLASADPDNDPVCANATAGCVDIASLP